MTGRSLDHAMENQQERQEESQDPAPAFQSNRRLLMAVAGLILGLLAGLAGLIYLSAHHAEYSPRPQPVSRDASPATAPRLVFPVTRYGPMDYVPAGPFIMGCDPKQDPECEEDESPVREITLSAYWIDRHETTAGAFRDCIAAGACGSSTYGEYMQSATCTVGDKKAFDQPVNCVSWRGADAFCRWAGKRLPSEAEWEKAARGPQGRKYPWPSGPPLCMRAVFHADKNDRSGCGQAKTWPVGSFPSETGPYGSLDLAGNVFEWTASWYNGLYYAQAPALDPPGPQHGSQRVRRGGSFRTAAKYIRASYRGRDEPLKFMDDVGFRCAVSASSAAGMAPP
ncbi:MAG: Hercynine oxygenase [Myxococcota bacterium]|nr:Hercynine oxygenase [Myxococcota bacterium]